MKRYRAVLFDLDNTLFDYDTAACNALRTTLLGTGISDDFKAAYADYHAINMRLWEELEAGETDLETLKVRRFQALGRHRGWPELDWAALGADYLRNLSEEAVLYPDTVPVLRTLAPHYILGILTNGIADVQITRMARSGLRHLFASFIISSQYGTAKPDPEIFTIAFNDMNVSVSDTLYVGDSVTSDMQGAINAGVDFCWLTSGDTRHGIPGGYRYRIGQLTALIDILV